MRQLQNGLRVAHVRQEASAVLLGVLVETRLQDTLQLAPRFIFRFVSYRRRVRVLPRSYCISC